jgi:hypothetical protein
MPIGKIGGGAGNSIPDLNELDSNPQSVASATGNEAKTGGIGHRAVQFLNKISSGLRQVADSFAHAIENRFSGSAKDNLKSLFHREPKQIDTPIELKSFKSHIDDTYARIANPAFDNSTYGETSISNAKNDDYALADEPTYASLSDIKTKSPADEPIYANAGEATPADTFEPIYQNVASRSERAKDEYVAADFAGDDYVEAAPEELYASLSDIATESLYAQLSDVATDDFGGFKPDATKPADTNFYPKVTDRSSPALKQALAFVRHVVDHHGAAGGKALAGAGIFVGRPTGPDGAIGKEVIGQVTPELFQTFQVKLKEAKAANAASVAKGFAPSKTEVRFEKYNSDNANSPIHAVLQKAVFANSPKLADKAKWEFDGILSRGASGASPTDLAESVARQVVAEKLKESFDAGRSDSPFHEVLANSSLANESNSKIEGIKASYDQALTDSALDYAYEGGLDKPFNPDAFKGAAIAAAQATIEKYTF